MNIDNIHDALGLLDDDLIEEVDVLRSKTGRRKQSQRKTTWRHLASVAACLCVIATSVCVASLRMKEFGSSKKDTANNVSVSEYSTVEDTSDSVKSQESTTSENKSEATGESAKESQSVLVEIKYWKSDGFVGTISGNDENEIYGVGTDVTVKFKDTVYVKVSHEEETEYVKTTPDSADFPDGSIVRVQFQTQENETNVANDTASEEIIIYAEVVAPAETE